MILVEEFGDIEGSSEGSFLANYKYQYKSDPETVEIVEDSELNETERQKWEMGKIKGDSRRKKKKEKRIFIFLNLHLKKNKSFCSKFSKKPYEYTF
jgi:hypothetical protein